MVDNELIEGGRTEKRTKGKGVYYRITGSPILLDVPGQPTTRDWLGPAGLTPPLSYAWSGREHILVC